MRSSKLIPILALSILLVPLSAFAQSAACNGLGAIFCEDFESGDLTHWTSPEVEILTPSNGTVTNASTVTVSGAALLLIGAYLDDDAAGIDSGTFHLLGHELSLPAQIRNE